MPTPVSDLVSPDVDLRNADWPKRTNDVVMLNHHGKIIGIGGVITHKTTDSSGNPVPLPLPSPSIKSAAYNPDQARDHQGRWTGDDDGGPTDPNSTPSPLSHPSVAAVTRLQNALKAHGGFTYNIVTGAEPKTGYMVSYAPQQRIVDSAKMTPDDITRYIKDNSDFLHQPGNYLGGWLNEGKVYLDVSTIKSSLKDANAVGHKEHQLAVYSLGEGKEYPVVEPSTFRGAAEGVTTTSTLTSTSIPATKPQLFLLGVHGAGLPTLADILKWYTAVTGRSATDQEKSDALATIQSFPSGQPQSQTR